MLMVPWTRLQLTASSPGRKGLSGGNEAQVIHLPCVAKAGDEHLGKDWAMVLLHV